MAIDLEKPRWRAGEAAEIAGIDVNQLGPLRKRNGFAIGKLVNAEHRFSVVDIAEMTTFVALRAADFSVPGALETARELRGEFKDLFVNRLYHGFWSLGAIEVDEDKSEFYHVKRLLYFDAIGERVINKLKLPLPVRPMPRNSQIAVRMTDAIMSYFESPPGLKRWTEWHAAVIKQGSTTWDEAAAVLGAPVWFLQALINATRDMPKPDDTPIVKAVRPRARPEMVAGITLH